MMKKAAFWFSCCALLGLAGCSVAAEDGHGSSHEALKGAWVADPGTSGAAEIEFGNDGSCRISSTPCTYTIDAGSEEPSIEAPWTVSMVLTDGVRRTLRIVATESEPNTTAHPSTEGFAFDGKNLVRVMGYELSGRKQSFFAYSKQGLETHGFAVNDSDPTHR